MLGLVALERSLKTCFKPENRKEGAMAENFLLHSPNFVEITSQTGYKGRKIKTENIT
jgi:hypothetical protein